MKVKMLLLIVALLVSLPTANAYSLNLSSDTGDEYSVDFIEGVADTSGLIFDDGDTLSLELIGDDNSIIAQTTFSINDLKQYYSVISVNAGDIYFEVYNLPNGAPMVHFSYPIQPFPGLLETSTHYLGSCTDNGINQFRSCDMDFINGSDFVIFEVQVHQNINFDVPQGDEANLSYSIVETYDGLRDKGVKRVDFLWNTNGSTNSNYITYSNNTTFVVETGVYIKYRTTIHPNVCSYDDTINQTPYFEIELEIGIQKSTSIITSPQPSYHFKWEMSNKPLPCFSIP